MYGAFSLETFCGAGGLSYTHEDAGGWLAYVEKFTARNFWYKDQNVKAWAYYEDYDNWQDTYGMDAVRAVYHSGHGGMGADGTFYAPVGADWGGLGCTVASNRMRFGDERARYVFWSTCTSLRVHDGHNPMRTWQARSGGLRMIFGFETVSVDDPNYGKNFWEEWNKNKPLSTAWLDASWRIAHDQAPSVMAFGANADEAKNRVFNERLLSDGRASNNWGWWRWYEATRAGRESVRMPPGNLAVASLRPASADPRVNDLADRFGVAAPLFSAGGRVAARNSHRSVVRDADGSISARLAEPNLSNIQPLSLRRARNLAEDTIRQYGLDGNVDLAFDRVLTAFSAGGSDAGSGAREAPRPDQTILQYRQVINGLPVINPDRGTVRIAIDNDGTATSIHAALQEVDTLHPATRADTAAMLPQPPEPESHGPMRGPSATEPHEAALDAAAAARLRRLAGVYFVGVADVPGSTEIGYDIQGNTGQVVARKTIEVDFGNGYRKRYQVTAPLSP